MVIGHTSAEREGAVSSWGKRWSAEELDQAMRRVKEGLPVLVGMCRACGLLVPEAEFRFHPVRKWRFDYAWPGMKVALEVEGGMWVDGRHNRGSGQVKDLEKYSEAAILGWRILYCQPSELATIGMERVERALKGDRDGTQSEELDCRGDQEAGGVAS